MKRWEACREADLPELLARIDVDPTERCDVAVPCNAGWWAVHVEHAR